jgi:mannosyl-oligosaccharide glucosidase
MAEDGWLAREQIPGQEARANVPGQLCIQNPQYANPPGLLLTINGLIERLETTPRDTKNLVLAFLRDSYERFKKNYLWYFRTQHGQCGSDMHCFRWRGRSTHHTLTSGLDDYPRADLPHNGELHVDLASWMAFASKVMMKYAQVVGNTEDYAMYFGNFKKIVNVIETVHWDPEEQYYTDVILDEDGDVRHIRHFGYVSIYPLLFGLASAGRVKRVLKRVAEELVTDYGLRSLSPHSPYYMKGDQYWTGPIWININYLFLGALQSPLYRDIDGALSVYERVRTGLMKAMLKSYQETGFIWEQYSDMTGRGQRSHPFTGWSSLILLIMSEKYQSF